MKLAKIKTFSAKSNSHEERPVGDKKEKFPNSDTLAAMRELKAGKGVKFKSAAALFKSI